MELMDISCDKLYKFVYGEMESSIPEEILGKIAVAVSCYTKTSVFIFLISIRFLLSLPIFIIENFAPLEKSTVFF